MFRTTLTVTVTVTIAISSLAAGCAHAQSTPLRILESPGILICGDFDADRRDDVLVLGAVPNSRTYFGTSKAPYLRPGPKWAFHVLWSLTDLPVFAGGYLYVPVFAARPGRCELHIYGFTDGTWVLNRALRIWPSRPGLLVNALKLHPLHRDIDGDGRPDVLAVWSESPLPSSGGLLVAQHAPAHSGNTVRLPRLPGQTVNSRIVDVHRLKTFRATTTYLLTIGADLANGTGGFGFATIDGDGKLTGAAWARNGPPLHYDKFLPVDSPVAVGEFNLFPGATTPLVELSTGPSILFSPWVNPPYVAARGEVLPTNRLSAFLDAATADFDGDGRDEVVWARGSPLHHLAWLHVGDPSAWRAYAQTFYLGSGNRAPAVFHATSGDFDGDGDPDLLVAYYYDGLPRNGYLAFFRADRSGGPGVPALRRIY